MLLVYINKILILFQIIFAFYMCTTLLAIEAVLSLVLTFLVVGLILFFFEIAFLGISYVIVYVGAIAILFLFVIMITPLKNSTSDLQSYHFAILLNTKKYSKRYLTFFLTILALSVWCFPELFFADLIIKNYMHLKSILDIIDDDLSDLSFLAQNLFNYTSFMVIISGFILLIALLGVILISFYNIIPYKLGMIWFIEIVTVFFSVLLFSNIRGLRS